ncbi:MAG: DUF1552 domain-containing protein [Alphaproteobacteria bacterium]|nr:DUF1552 domain-containing protein [Alphaproteobacteria bacterium]
MSVSRRGFLKGLGSLLPLPVMASLPGTARAASRSPNFVFYFVPNGMVPARWEPAEEGAGYVLPELLEPLAAVRDRVTVLTGMANPPASASTLGMDHARCTSAFLTCADLGRMDAPPGYGVSIDQVLAEGLGRDLRFRSLVLGSESSLSCTLDACARLHHVSWSDLATPMAVDIHPSSVFARLFGVAAADGQSAAARVRERAARQSVLDHVIGQVGDLQRVLGGDDQLVLQQYLDGVRDLERRLGVSGTLSCEAPELALSGLDPTSHAEVMNRLIVLALQCGQTRVVSYMLGHGQSERTFGFLGYPGGHHSYTHSGSDLGVRAICRWEVARFADLVARLAEVPTATGSLLDDTWVLLGSGMGHGADHEAVRLPLLLAGGEGGGFVQGRHLRQPDGTPLSRLYLSLLQSAGLPQTTFGDDGDRPLLELG